MKKAVEIASSMVLMGVVGKFCVILQSKDCFCFVNQNQKTSALWIAY